MIYLKGLSASLSNRLHTTKGTGGKHNESD